ncbi:MAG: hypothetical protein U0X20_03635 [Caldilineaceae bacterium]
MLATHADTEYAPRHRSADRTLTLSSLHVPRIDLERIRAQGWLLDSSSTEHQVSIALPQKRRNENQRDVFLSQLCTAGYTQWFVDLMLWARDADIQYLQFDDAAEPSDRLLIFVG